MLLSAFTLESPLQHLHHSPQIVPLRSFPSDHSSQIIPLTSFINSHSCSLLECSLAFTATSPPADGERAYITTASHPAPPSLLHIHSINNIPRLPHLASYFYIVKYLLLYTIISILYTVTPTQLSSIHRQRNTSHSTASKLLLLFLLLIMHSCPPLHTTTLSIVPTSISRRITPPFRLQASRKTYHK